MHIWTSSLPLAMFTDSDSDSNSTSDSGLDEHPFDVDEPAPSSDPHLRHTDRCRQFLNNSGNISDRVLQVLALMDDLHLNLPLFLWAISWNVPELISNHRVRYARTAQKGHPKRHGLSRTCPSNNYTIHPEHESFRHIYLPRVRCLSTKSGFKFVFDRLPSCYRVIGELAPLCFDGDPIFLRSRASRLSAEFEFRHPVGMSELALARATAEFEFRHPVRIGKLTLARAATAEFQI